MKRPVIVGLVILVLFLIHGVVYCIKKNMHCLISKKKLFVTIFSRERFERPQGYLCHFHCFIPSYYYSPLE